MKTYIAANWKMNKNPSESERLIKAFQFPPSDEKVETIIFPAFTSLERLSKLNLPVKLGAQNFHQEKSGAFTGEISIEMLADFALDYLLLGHSERRHLFHESDELIQQKLQQALNYPYKIILCLGEELSDREAGKTEELIQSQLKTALAHVEKEALKQLFIAYEPVWAIGTGLTASPQEAQSVHAFIRSELSSLYSKAVASELPILYGGSVKASNIKDLLSEEDINGALIGGASLKSEEFNQILHIAAETK